jgi:hypothetical protein
MNELRLMRKRDVPSGPVSGPVLYHWFEADVGGERFDCNLTWMAACPVCAGPLSLREAAGTGGA